MDTGGLARLYTELDAWQQASMLLTYRRNQCDNGASHARNQSFEWTPVRTGIILGRSAHSVLPLLKTSSADPQSVYGTAAGCNQEKNTPAGTGDDAQKRRSRNRHVFARATGFYCRLTLVAISVFYSDHPPPDFSPSLYFAPAHEATPPTIAITYARLSRDIPV